MKTAPSTTGSTDLPILDTSRLETILDNNHELILTMVMDFNEVLLQDLEQITLEFENSYDFNSIRNQAHRIKGSSANLGAHALADISTRLEEASIEQNTEKVDSILHSFTDTARRTLDEIKVRLNN